MREIVILSGKGGTGKTSLTAAFAHLASNHVICDLDVDAPDLHLILSPSHLSENTFVSGHEAVITDRCEGCGQCVEMCRYEAISEGDPYPTINPLKCEGCKVCVQFCPADAIDFPEKECGQWYLSQTRFGTMVHARLYPGEENSGRLVTLLRQQAKALADARGYKYILSDGPPGIGCPVISSLSGSSTAVIITEPTPSGRHDLERVIELCRHFNVVAGVVINKYDLSKTQTAAIESYCQKHRLVLLGRLPHDEAMVRAMIQGKAITEYQTDGIASDVRELWSDIIHIAGIREAA